MIMWDGNKRIFYNRIKPYIKRRRFWIEPFFGGGGIGFNVMKDFDFSVYLLNDKSDILYDIYMVLSNYGQAKKLWRMVENYINSETYYQELYYKYIKGDYQDKVERVFMFLVVRYFNVYNKESKTLGYHRHAKDILLKNIKEIIKLLREKPVTIANKDYKDFLKACNTRDILKSNFVYCDPPYNNTAPKGYKGKFNIIELFEALQPFMDNPILISYNDWQDEWTKYGFELIKILVEDNAHKRRSQKEILIGNKHINKYETVLLF